MRIFVIILSFLLTVISVAAKPTKVTGVVVAGSDVVEYASITIADASEKVISYCYSNRNGEFSTEIRKDGTYFFTINYLGYKTYKTTVKCHGDDVVLGEIRLKQGKEELEAAKVTSSSLLVHEGDRITYDVLSDPEASKKTMSAFMEKIPGLVTSQTTGKLQFNDVAIAEILVDDKNSPMVNARRQYPMSFIKADYMSKIELILPGSPEYGNKEPILIIRLDRPIPYGFASEISAGASTHNQYSVSPDVLINTPFVGIGISYDFDYSCGPYVVDYKKLVTNSENRQDEEWVKESRDSCINKKEKHNLGIDLFRSFLSNKIDVQFSFNTSHSYSAEKLSSISETISSGERTDATGYNSFRKNVSPMRLNLGVQVGYNWGIRNNLTLKYTFADHITKSSDNREIYSNLSQEYEELAGVHNSTEQNISAALNLYDSDKRKRWGVGLSSGLIMRDYFSKQDRGVDHLTLMSGMEYSQRVLYFDAGFNGHAAHKKFLYAVNLNAEYIRNRGEDLHDGRSLDYDDFNFVPSLRLKWRVSRACNLSVAYRSRSKRPNEEILNPTEVWRNPYHVLTGNPHLKGEISHHTTFDYDQRIPLRWFPSFELGVGYNITPNAIEKVLDRESDGVIHETYANIGMRDRLRFNVGARFVIAKIARLSINANAERSSYNLGNGFNSEYWNFGVREVLSLNLKVLSIIQTLFVTRPVTCAQTKSMTYDPVLGLSLSRYWKKINLGTSLNFSDILHGRSSRPIVNQGIGFEEFVQSQRLGRSVSVEVFWRFGKFKNHPKVSHDLYDM